MLLAAAVGLPPAVSRYAADGKPSERRERIYFSVLDKEEKPVPGLTDRDFGLRLNGKSVSLEDFRPGLPYTDKSIPLVLWILIDFNPNIDANLISRQSRAAAEVLNLVHPDSAVGVKLVSDRSETLAPLGHDPAALRKAFLEFSQVRNQLRVGATGAEVVGAGGILRAMNPAMDEIDRFVDSDPRLQNREVHRAILILSDGNINPSFDRKPLYRKAARSNVCFYPVFLPRARYGSWLEDYFDIGKKSGGLASVLGALNAGSKTLPLPKGNANANALTINFIHMLRDLNGKYSFSVRTGGPEELRLDLKCLVKGVSLRSPRRTLP